ncbi:uncharacterized protein LOC120155666 [Hibiscus syriacus]|uniref:uncharacterized protein LOC120155666 n=1 Tax=Hibiscus syriacus TaxID=106335 RepID=UPI001920D6ED|nr:uncharacterized protein LOC120155666 [Hibiscus syriacus]
MYMLIILQEPFLCMQNALDCALGSPTSVNFFSLFITFRTKKENKGTENLIVVSSHLQNGTKFLGQIKICIFILFRAIHPPLYLSSYRLSISFSISYANRKVATSQHAVAAVTSASRNSNPPKLSAGERKAATLYPISGFTVEKRPSLDQTQGRNDFFNLLKKKTSTNTSAGLSGLDPHISSSTVEKSEVSNGVASASAPAHGNETCTVATSNDDTRQDAQGFSDDCEKDMISFAMVYPDEEEAAFLRSLGWEENSGEDEGLTEEEINAFCKEYMKLMPSLKPCSSILPKLCSISCN